jgi:hypothetical protein
MSQIHNARAKVLEPTSLFPKSFGDFDSPSDYHSIKLGFKDQCVFVGSTSVDSFAVLNEETTKVLQELSRSDSCQFDAFLSLEERDSLLDSKTKAERHVYFLIDIVLYGSRVIRDNVGEVLSDARIYLQHPCHQKPGTEYDNPHFLKLTVTSLPQSESSTGNRSLPSDISILSIPDENADSEVKTQAQLRNRLAIAFENLTRYKKLEYFKADIKITRKLLP